MPVLAACSRNAAPLRKSRSLSGPDVRMLPRFTAASALPPSAAFPSQSRPSAMSRSMKSEKMRVMPRWNIALTQPFSERLLRKFRSRVLELAFTTQATRRSSALPAPSACPSAPFPARLSFTSVAYSLANEELSSSDQKRGFTPTPGCTPLFLAAAMERPGDLTDFDFHLKRFDDCLMALSAIAAGS